MWNRKENEMPNTSPQRPSDDGPRQSIVSKEFGDAPSPSSSQIQRTPRGSVGKSICIRGELTGNEDLTIEGTVEGKIAHQSHHLTIGKNGRVKANIRARLITVYGTVEGDLHGDEGVEISASARVTGNVVGPRVTLEGGATFKGSITTGEDLRAAARSAPAAATTQVDAGRATQGAAAETPSFAMRGSAATVTR